VRQGSILGPLLFLIHVADLPHALEVVGGRNRSSVGGKGADSHTGSYADDSHATAIGNTVHKVVQALNRKALLFAKWAKGNGLALNGEKTQFLLSCSAGNTDGITINVDGKEVAAASTMDLLGTTLDRKFSFAPHAKATAGAARQRASLIARLGNHLPPGKYLRSLAMGLAVGKVSHAIAASATPRLNALEPLPASAKATQVALNDVSRTVTGGKRTDHVAVEDLLTRANRMSFNRLAAVAAATETWKSFHSTDGEDGGKTPLKKPSSNRYRGVARER
jgi:hypothetical protein